MDVQHILSPYIRLALYDIINPPVSLAERVLYDYELLYVKSGNIRITMDGKIYEGTAGNAFLLKPGQRHIIEIYGNHQFIQPHIHFDLAYFSDRDQVGISFKTYEDMSEQELSFIRPDFLKNQLDNIPVMIKLENTALFETLMFDVIQEFQNSGRFHEFAINGLFLTLMNQFLTEAAWNNTPSHSIKQQQVYLVKQFIEHNVNRNLKMDDISRIIYLEKHSISRLFKELYKKTPLQYHTQLRIERAKNMIHLTNLSLTAISNNIGYESIHCFSRAFKRVEGISPSAYRQKLISG